MSPKQKKTASKKKSAGARKPAQSKKKAQPKKGLLKTIRSLFGGHKKPAKKIPPMKKKTVSVHKTKTAKTVVKKTVKKPVAHKPHQGKKQAPQLKKKEAPAKAVKPAKAAEEENGEMSKAYDPGTTEDKIYQSWLQHDVFSPKETKNKKRFVVSMPPPNVTGMLHLGHAITLTTEDLMVRYHRMLKDETVYVPGTDHAGIATQVVVEKRLAEEGKTRQSLGREKFVESVWEWKEKYHEIIANQIKKMGTSCDWGRERFTMDKGLSRAVKRAFVELYDEGLIYKGDYLVNWCPRCQTVLSDMEVNYKEENGKLYFIRYFVKAADKSVVVATARPETMLGDTGVAVHPEDKRYKEFLGKTLILPILNREIPVITDENVDMNFGTGALKITPAHDIVDFEVGKKHGLQVISVIGKDGKMSKNAGKFAGLSTEQARENIVEYLNNIGNLEESKDYLHNVGYCSRCDTKVEPYLSTQWFVKMRPLAEETLKVLEKEELKFVPERFEKTFKDWLANTHDWCISRQLWWGHRIPAYTNKKTKKLVVMEELPKSAKESDFIQEEDVLDTWFSSALWPFSTLGWPLKTEDLKKYYPINVMETGYDIIFFWVMRMVFMGVHFMKTLPFKTVYLHGLVRDEQGRKMSKSLGNGIDPIEVIKDFGADALRLTLTIGNTPGNDLKFSLNKVQGNRNFVNKLWNASRFILMNVKDKQKYRDLEKTVSSKFNRMPPSAKWILTRLEQVTQQVTGKMNEYKYGEAGSQLYDFTWGEFCDWYIELAKINPTPLVQDVLQYCMLTVLKLWHPFIPFVTEKIWSMFEQREMLITSEWPEYDKELVDDANLSRMESIFDIVRTIRNLRAEKQIENNRKIHAVVVAHEHTPLVQEYSETIQILAKISHIKITKDAKPSEESLTGMVGTTEIYLPLSGLVNIEQEKKKIQTEVDRKETFKKGLEAKLKNKDFLKKAKKEIVQMEKEKLKKIEIEIQSLKEQMRKLR